MKKSVIDGVDKFSSDVEKAFSINVKKAKRSSKKTIILTLTGLVLVWAWSTSVYMFTEKYKFQAPILIEFQPLIIKRDAKSHKVIETPVKSQNMMPVVEAKEVSKPMTEEELIKSQKHGELMWKVYTLESSKGKNDGCRDKGKYNGFGYGQNTTVWNCFDTLEEVVTKVNGWFEKELAKSDEPTALCYYNTGTRQPNCNYYQNYLSL